MALRILANDGIDEAGRKMLEEAGFQVSDDNFSAEELLKEISNFDILLVRSATKVTAQLMDVSQLKAIGRAGVGMDNIDREHAKAKDIKVFNTPSASSISVAELVFAHLLGLCRNLPETNRIMPTQGDVKFKELKKKSSEGIELYSKTIGIIGFGRIGQEVARIALGMGMKVLAYDPYVKSAHIKISLHSDYDVNAQVEIATTDLKDLLKNSDFITLHIPGQQKPVIGETELNMMKKGTGIVNCARGGVVDEKALLAALNAGHIAFAGLDVFEKEPPVFMDILAHPGVSLSPHIGASTVEAQERVGIELADYIISNFS